MAKFISPLFPALSPCQKQETVLPAIVVELQKETFKGFSDAERKQLSQMLNRAIAQVS